MIVKILKPAKGFPAVRYNTDKVERNKGQLMAVENFGFAQAVSRMRPQDHTNYLELWSARNGRVARPQFHAVISAKGNAYSKDELTSVGKQWLKEMGYGEQPFMIVYHKDTDHHHVHLVTTRIDRHGKKINDSFENLRAVKSLDRVLGYEYAMRFQFSTKAQFYTLLECAGYSGRDQREALLDKKIRSFITDKSAIERVRNILIEQKDRPGGPADLKNAYGIELVFHASEGKTPYGYTVIDHPNLIVYKGSEILPLKQLIGHPVSAFWPSANTVCTRRLPSTAA